MRKINWEEKLSDDDVTWLRTTGIVDIEDRIVRHQSQFDAEVPELEVPEDEATKDVLDPTARRGTPVEGGDGPKLVDPTKADPPAEDEDDYDEWKAADLDVELKARNELEGITPVEAEGTGANGKVLKTDLIAAMRAWDKANPTALV